MLRIDYANCLAERVGEHGVGADALAGATGALEQLVESLNGTRGTGWERWRTLPFDPARSEHVEAIRDLVKKLRPTTDNLVVLGIGGSALGNIALHGALRPANWNLLPDESRDGPRLFVLDNIDPVFVGGVLDEVRRDDPDLARTVFNVISKSGETAETASQFMIARSMLAEALGADAARHIVAITDPRQGTMRAICDEAGYATLPVPDGVGGRFSVLSPVGLFSAAMCGIDIDALLDGAAEMDTQAPRRGVDRARDAAPPPRSARGDHSRGRRSRAGTTRPARCARSRPPRLLRGDRPRARRPASSDRRPRPPARRRPRPQAA